MYFRDQWKKQFSQILFIYIHALTHYQHFCSTNKENNRGLYHQREDAEAVLAKNKKRSSLENGSAEFDHETLDNSTHGLSWFASSVASSTNRTKRKLMVSVPIASKHCKMQFNFHQFMIFLPRLAHSIPLPASNIINLNTEFYLNKAPYTHRSHICVSQWVQIEALYG